MLKTISVTFRESRPSGRVKVLCNKKVVYSNDEYMTAARWAGRVYGLTQEEFHKIYKEYKKNR